MPERSPKGLSDVKEDDAAAIRVVGAAIVVGRRCLVARRGPEMSLPLRWEFPGGKVADDESPKQALVREIREELGLEIEVGEWLAEGRDRTVGSADSSRDIVLDVYRASLEGGALWLAEHQEVRWVSANELDELEWAKADLPAVEVLRGLLAASA